MQVGDFFRIQNRSQGFKFAITDTYEIDNLNSSKSDCLNNIVVIGIFPFEIG